MGIALALWYTEAGIKVLVGGGVTACRNEY